MRVHYCVRATWLGIASVGRGKVIVQASRAPFLCRAIWASSVSQRRNRYTVLATSEVMLKSRVYCCCRYRRSQLACRPAGRQPSSICSQKTELPVPEIAAATHVRLWCYLPDNLVWRGAFWFLVGGLRPHSSICRTLMCVFGQLAFTCRFCAICPGLVCWSIHLS